MASTMVELSDVSFRGCRLCTLADAAPPDIDALVAFGFVLPERQIALCRGRVVRRVEAAHGGGFGLIINRANATFYEFLMTLAETDRHLASPPVRVGPVAPVAAAG